MRTFIPNLVALLSLTTYVFADAGQPGTEAQLAKMEDQLAKAAPAPAAPKPAQAAPAPVAAPADSKAKDASEAKSKAESKEPSDGSTTFNGITVPAMKELEGHKWDEQTKEGYWFVKHYSPQCPHCIKIAPVWQKLYEFYYVSYPPLPEAYTTDSA